MCKWVHSLRRSRGRSCRRDFEQFRAIILSEMKNEKEFDLLVTPSSSQGKKAEKTTSGHDVRKSHAPPRSEGRRRAILRAPDFIQKLYRDGLIAQELAAHFGPDKSRKDYEERAEKVS